MKKFKRIIILLTTTIFALSLFGCESKKEHAKNVKLTISAAASLKEVMLEIEKEYEKMNPNVDLIFNFGSSGSLQKQIEQGAPSDVFISLLLNISFMVFSSTSWKNSSLLISLTVESILLLHSHNINSLLWL